MNIERAQELNNSTLWNDVVLELDRLIAVDMAKLRKCKPEDVVKIQTEIETFEFIKALPQTVIDREA